ncbi:unnamed protein product [Wuchereria bancrofti]|uniref:Uncharacterized protein n=2 Tax=Wuchereria bancrofti TaxID=6293 RepID=A0A3P7EUB5_WUCBA|nr:unnamed protein product [Wuchereria bancrofti]
MINKRNLSLFSKIKDVNNSGSCHVDDIATEVFHSADSRAILKIVANITSRTIHDSPSKRKLQHRHL